MELVAASKMRRAQTRALAAARTPRRCARSSATSRSSAASDEDTHPLLTERPVKNTLDPLPRPEPRPRRRPDREPEPPRRRRSRSSRRRRSSFVTVGKKGARLLRRAPASRSSPSSRMPRLPGLLDTLPIDAHRHRRLRSPGASTASSCSTRSFVNTAVQRPTCASSCRSSRRRSPTSRSRTSTTSTSRARRACFAELLPRYVEMTIYAGHPRDRGQRAVRAHGRDAQRHRRRERDDRDLTLIYNKARQEQITKELLDIVGGVEAMKG